MAREDQFNETTGFGEVQGEGERRRVFSDRGARVLGVAHLDSVEDDRWCNHCMVGSDTVVYSPNLDDRLGVYVITNLLPRLGVEADWLLTTGEEQGASSGLHFSAEKNYRWMFQFDRRGTDAVMYQYRTRQYRELVERCGVTVHHGSFSDIASMEHLGCMGVNFGCGYEDYHSTRAHFWLSDLVLQVSRFLTLYRQIGERELPFDHESDKEEIRSYSSTGMTYGKTGTVKVGATGSAYTPSSYTNEQGETTSFPEDAEEGLVVKGRYGAWVSTERDWVYCSDRDPAWAEVLGQWEQQQGGEAEVKALPPHEDDYLPAHWKPRHRPANMTLPDYFRFLFDMDRDSLTDGEWRDLCELEEEMYTEDAV